MIALDKIGLETYQHANYGNQEDDFHQAIEDEENAAKHLCGWMDGPIRGM